MRCRTGHESILILPTPSPLMCPHIPAEKWSPRLQGCEKEVVGGTYLRARWSWKPNWSLVTDFALQKLEKHGEKWAGSWLPAFLFRRAHPCQAVFPAGHSTFRKGDWEAEGAWLLTRGPAFPRAPGTPGKPWLPWERHIFSEHNEA